MSERRWRYDALCEVTAADHPAGRSCEPLLPHSHRGQSIKWARMTGAEPSQTITVARGIRDVVRERGANTSGADELIADLFDLWEAAALAGPGADRLDVERLVDAMNECYTYEDRDNAVPTLPFIDDIEGFWGPFARCVAAEYAALSRSETT